jgi:D-glycero-alpha-D-manno-heptose-7-phosphate kinase
LVCITKTPLRVSLFGGGTDYPEYYERMPGAVVGMAIDKYIYIAALPLTGHQLYNYRVSYSTLELTSDIAAIQHPVVREVLRVFEVKDRLDISIMSDLPATGSGLGSSSAFTVGFLNIAYSLTGRACTKIDLARKAIHIEREVLRENVGVQDQLHATFGGMNRFDFNGKQISITPLQVSGETMHLLSQSLVLVHTGIARRATTIVEEQVKATKSASIDKDLSSLFALVGECASLLEGPTASLLPMLGKMLSESWYIKRSLTKQISNTEIDNLFNVILKAGAYGAKLCGAGGGGYFLVLIDSDRIEALRKAVDQLIVIPITIDTDGSTLVYTSRPKLGWQP